MFRIRPEQLKSLDREQEQQFVGELVGHLKRHHRRVVAGLPDEMLRTMVSNGVARAKSRGLTWESSITAFVALMFEVAPDFDEYPRFNEILSDPAVEPDARVDLLRQRATEDDWEQALLAGNPGAWFTLPDL